jgi:Lrp/AsnC family transcriptional regulator for asnA, asnC and gidA
MSKFRLDEVDHQILDMLIDNTVPFTDIALLISAGTVHVKDAGIIMVIVSSDYDKLGYSLLLM